MSLETIVIIVVLTLLTIVLGTDLFWLIVVKAAFVHVSDGSLLDTMGQIHRNAAQRMPIVFVILLVGAITLNFVPHSRTEVYLLRIGLVSYVAYAAIVLAGLVPINNQIIGMLNGDNAGGKIRSLQAAWDRLLWWRVLTALVAFWSFLHYAMNPRV